MPKISEEIRECYRQRLILPEFPSSDNLVEFRTTSGTVVALGYERVVIGDRGPYVEFSPKHIKKLSWHIPDDENWRIYGRCYYIEARTIDEAFVKMYYQKATVNYADYKVGMWYISPFDLVIDRWPVLPIVGECCFPVPGDLDLVFWIGDPIEIVPVLPFKAKGKLWHMGWDIPTAWVIDGAGQCWMNDAHGHCLYLVPNEILIREAENGDDRNHIRKTLGLPLEEPEWMKLAKAAGWQPPKES